jgi:tRNA G18 (ribose-2'-O)-methylase SpoU
MTDAATSMNVRNAAAIALSDVQPKHFKPLNAI